MKRIFFTLFAVAFFTLAPAPPEAGRCGVSLGTTSREAADSCRRSFTSLCFAQETSAPINQTATPIPQAAPKPDETKTFTGRIDSLSSSTMSFSGVSMMPFVGFSKGKKEIKDKGSGKKGKDDGKKPKNMTVVDGKGQKLRFKVKRDILITDRNGKTVNLNQIEKGDRVTVAYLTNTKKGTLEATSIKLIARKNIMLKIMDNVL